jgi:hypothetical protein
MSGQLGAVRIKSIRGAVASVSQKFRHGTPYKIVSLSGETSHIPNSEPQTQGHACGIAQQVPGEFELLALHMSPLSPRSSLIGYRASRRE